MLYIVEKIFITLPIIWFLLEGTIRWCKFRTSSFKSSTSSYCFQSLSSLNFCVNSWGLTKKKKKNLFNVQKKNTKRTKNDQNNIYIYIYKLDPFHPHVGISHIWVRSNTLNTPLREKNNRSQSFFDVHVVNYTLVN